MYIVTFLLFVAGAAKGGGRRRGRGVKPRNKKNGIIDSMNTISFYIQPHIISALYIHIFDIIIRIIYRIFNNE